MPIPGCLYRFHALSTGPNREKYLTYLSKKRATLFLLHPLAQVRSVQRGEPLDTIAQIRAQIATDFELRIDRAEKRIAELKLQRQSIALFHMLPLMMSTSIFRDDRASMRRKFDEVLGVKCLC